jgi:hypothetical protein
MIEPTVAEILEAGVRSRILRRTAFNHKEFYLYPVLPDIGAKHRWRQINSQWIKHQFPCLSKSCRMFDALELYPGLLPTKGKEWSALPAFPPPRGRSGALLHAATGKNNTVSSVLSGF